MFGYSEYGMQPVQPVQFAPQLSKIDAMRIAMNVKSLLSDEITQIVSLKMQEQTQHLTSRTDTLEKENGEIKAALSSNLRQMNWNRIVGPAFESRVWRKPLMKT